VLKYFLEISIKTCILIVFVLLPIACDSERSKQIISQSTEDSIPVFEDPYPLIRYQLDTIRDISHRNEIINSFTPREGNFKASKTFTTLNRKELRFIGVGSAVVIPDTIYDDLKAYSVFPDYYHGARNIPKIIMVSNQYLAYGAYEYGKLVRFAAVNTGKERTPSYPGRYAVTWRKRLHRSSIDSQWVMPFTINFHSQAGSAFHKFSMPGKPASHSCVRQFLDDAEWLYYWVDLAKYNSNGKPIRMSGTPVIIIDHYDHSPGEGGKWKYIKDNKFKIDYLPEKPLEVEEAIIPISQIPVDARGSLVNYKKYLYGEDTLRARGIILPGVRLIETRNFNRERRKRAQREAAAREKTNLDSIQKAGRNFVPLTQPKIKSEDTDNNQDSRPDTLTIIR